ncbi:MAG: DUF4276 family protein [Acidobacteria bacterium]|nr:DUF4276 family protein [Acidobacteriota bacterium]
MNRRSIRFVFLCEGSSDQALVPHLRELLSHCGAGEVVGTSIPFGSVRAPERRSGHAIARKINAVLSTDSAFDLVFIHRDANTVGPIARADEIKRFMDEVRLEPKAPDWIPVIPVTATEAWLLLDETAIRRVAGNPGGRQPLQLPRPAQVENVSDPKEMLRTALANASGKQGRRLSKVRNNFGRQRRILLEQLPVGGALEQVPAWRQLKQNVSAFVRT